MSALFERLAGLTLLDPGFLALAFLVPLAYVLRRRRGEPAILFAPGALFVRPGNPGLPRTWRVRLLPLPGWLVALALLSTVVALARPATRALAADEKEGIDILLCLDTSSSMNADDMDRRRTRLEVARDAASRFVTARPEDRIGLVTFARYPDVVCPLTLDHDALQELLAAVVPVESESAEDATGIGAAVARAAAVFETSGAPSKVVILLTDGEENVALAGSPGEIPPVHAAQLARTLGVRVYAIVAGVGRRDASGRSRKLDTAPIERLAARTGGTFHRAEDAGAVTAVYETIDDLEKAPAEEPRTVFRARHLPFLVAAVLFLLLALVLASTCLEVLP